MKMPSSQGLNRIGKLVVFLFLLYAFGHAIFGPRHPAPLLASKPGAAQTAVSGDCAGTAMNNFSMLAFPMFPAMHPALRIEDRKDGTGEGAACGQDATLKFAYTSVNKTEVFSNLKGEPDTIRIGGKDLLPGLEQGLTGLKAGGERAILIPGMLGFAGVKDVHTLRHNDQFKFTPAAEGIVAQAALLALSPALPQSPMKLRYMNGVFGGGDEVTCGDKARAGITVWKIDGTKLFSTDETPVIFTLGEGALPLGIEQGITGMRAGGTRTLVLPPAFAAPFNPLPGVVPIINAAVFPANETVLVEVKLEPMSVEDEKKAEEKTKEGAAPAPDKK